MAGKDHDSYKHVTIRPKEWSQYEHQLTVAIDRLQRRVEFVLSVHRSAFLADTVTPLQLVDGL